VLAKVSPKDVRSIDRHTATGAAVAKVPNRTVGLICLNARSSVVAVVVSALTAPELAQQTRKASDAVTVLQIERIGPVVGFFVNAAVVVLPRGRANLAGSVVLAVELTSAGCLALEELAMWPFVAV